jgi:hypothetical protein
MRGAYALLLFCVLIAPAPHAWAGGRVEYAFCAYPIEKIGPHEMPAAASGATVRIAGNEFESVLLGVSNPTRAAIRVSEIDAVSDRECGCSLALYRVAYIPIRQGSRWFASTGGLWPDPIVPLASTIWRPEGGMEIPPGENRLFLLELYLAPGSRAEEKIGIVMLLSNGRELHLDVRVSSWDFDLPREPSMASAFQLSPGLAAKKHAALSDVPFIGEDLGMEYIHLLARYGLTVYRPFEQSPAEVKSDGTLAFDWTGFDRITGGLLDGTLFPDVPPSTSFVTPNPPAKLTPEQKYLFYREVADHMRRRGWLSRMFYYLPDEPLRSEYPNVIEIAQGLKAIDPDIRTLVTEPFAAELEGSVDIWCPDIPYLGDSIFMLPIAARGMFRLVPDAQVNLPPAVYAQRRQKGEQTWMYTCMSALFLDYPNLFIDSEASAARVIPWLAFRYGFTGLLYWNTIYSYSKSGDPWEDQYQFMSNGDGNLLYPGIPGRPDVSEHTPIPSLRLQILRDGFEDYEYLSLFARVAGAASAVSAAARVAESSLTWLHGSSEVESIREKLGAGIEAASGR